MSSLVASVVSSCDAVVHDLALKLGRPDGNINCIPNPKPIRSTEVNAVLVHGIPHRFDIEYPREGKDPPPPLLHSDRLPALTLHVQGGHHPPDHHDCVSLPDDGTAPEEPTAQGCVRLLDVVSLRIPHLSHDYQLRWLGYGYHHLHHDTDSEALCTRLLLQGWRSG